MRCLTTIALITLAGLLVVAPPAAAEGDGPSLLMAPASSAFSYQGQLLDEGAPYNGTGDFVFRLYDAASGGAQVGATDFVYGVTIDDGIFTTLVDFGLAAFDGNARWLDIQVRTPASPAGSGDPYTALTPRQELTAVPYALRALSGGGGSGLWSQSGSAIQNTNGGFVGINRTDQVTPYEHFGIQAPAAGTDWGGMYIRTDSDTAKPFYGYRVGTRAAWTQLDGSTGAWALFNSGQHLTVLESGNVGVGATAPTHKLEVAGQVKSTTGGFVFPDGSVQTTAASGGGGSADNDWLVNGSDMSSIPTGNVGVGTSTPTADLHVWDDNLGTSLEIEDGTPTGSFHDALLRFRTPNGDGRIEFFTSGSPSQATMYFSGGGNSPMNINMNGKSFEFNTAETTRFEVNNSLVARFNADRTTEWVDDDGTPTIVFDGDDPSSGGGQIELFKGDGTRTMVLNGAAGSGAQGASISLFTDGNPSTATAVLDGEYGGTAGGALLLRNSSGEKSVEIVSDLTPNEQGALWMYQPDGTRTVEIWPEETGDPTQGASIKLYDDIGNLTIELDADYGAGGEGRIITEVIEITGGSDLSEQFDVTSDGGEIEPGSVVSIDPASPGDLRRSDRAYDRRVAGIVSGAGGVKPGMLMGQRGSEADGQHPVALTGRVYCKVDASYGPIEPGDLLTTSDTPGYAMKVTDHTRATGAILGKAMTGLASGKGEVLVLVSLQ